MNISNMSNAQHKFLFTSSISPFQLTKRKMSSTTTTTTAAQQDVDEESETDIHKVAPRKQRIPRNLADGDRIMKVFGNPLDEDPTEPIVRSILPGGIARVTGIENPRLGSFVAIHINQNKIDSFGGHNTPTHHNFNSSHVGQTGTSNDVINANRANKELQRINNPIRSE
eukprot:UN03008